MIGLICVSVWGGCKWQTHRTRVAVIEPTGGLQYWEAFNHQLIRGNPEIEFRFFAPESINDFPVQARMVADAINEHFDGIILSPSHPLVLASVVKRALENKIPMVIVGEPLEVATRPGLAVVGWSNEQIGRIAAERLIQKMHGRGRVGVISGSPTLQGTVAREDAFLERIRLEPKMQTLGVQYALSDWGRAREMALDLAHSTGGVQGIFATDEFCTHGVISAFEKTTGSRPAIVGVAEESDQLNALVAGHADAMIVSDPFALADDSIKAFTALQANKSPVPTVRVDLFAVDANWAVDPRVSFLSKMR